MSSATTFYSTSSSDDKELEVPGCNKESNSKVEDLTEEQGIMCQEVQIWCKFKVDDSNIDFGAAILVGRIISGRINSTRLPDISPDWVLSFLVVENLNEDLD